MRPRTRRRPFCPMDAGDLRDLFLHLGRSDAPSCDNTLKETLIFLSERGLPPRPIISWLKAHGGFCDCEVSINVRNAAAAFVGLDD